MATKRTVTRRQLILQNRLMRSHIQGIYNALQTQVNHFATIVQENGTEFALSELNKHFYINEDIGPAVRDLYRDAASQAEPRLRVAKGLLIPLFGFVKDVIDYFNQFLLDKVVLPISRSMIEQIRVILKAAIANGDGVDVTVRKLKDSPITRRRAKTIVRTESVRAMNYSQLRAADNDKFEVQKTWIAVEDKRTRYMHTHAGVDGETRDLNAEFSNGLLFPGDPEGSAAETINCRCSLGYRLKRDQNGDFIRKQPLVRAIGKDGIITITGKEVIIPLERLQMWYDGKIKVKLD